VNPVIRREKMLKKQLTLLFGLVLAVPLATAVRAQEAPAKSKEARWEGTVLTTSKEQSSLTVRQAGSNLQKTCVYNSSTKWVSQYHHDKKINNIDVGQVKEGDYVICRGSAEKGGEIHASLISKRLSHSPQ
jgi:hypothetical protein